MAKVKKRKVAKKLIVKKIYKPVKPRKFLVKKTNKKIQIKKSPRNKPAKKITASKKSIKVKARKIVKIKSKKIIRRPEKKIAKKIVKLEKAKKPAVHHKRKHATHTENVEFASEALFKAKIKVIGIGGGGGSIVSEIGRSLEKATFVIADTDIRALKKKSGIKYFWFGQDLTHGLGTGVNIELAKQAAEASKEKISEIFKDQDIIIFIASLGGGLGSGATQVFAEAARNFGGITLGIFTMPFRFEGKNKQRIAQNALRALKQSLNVSLVIPNEKIFKIIDVNTPITNAFSTVNKNLIESLESLIDLIYNPGVINIDFADLRTVLKGRGNSAFLNTVEESGKDRVEKVCQKILINPLLQNSGFEPEKILFNIAGTENLSMFDVEKISSHIANLNPNAKIIFGISKNPKLNNKIKTTILMTGGSENSPEKEEIVQEIGEVAKKEIKPIVDKKTVKEATKEKTKEKIAKQPSVLHESVAEKAVQEKKQKKKPKSKPPKAVKKTKEKSVEKKDDRKAKKEPTSPSLIPVFEVPMPQQPTPIIPVIDQKRLDLVETPLVNNQDSSGLAGKKAIRRSGLEIKKAEELQEKKRIAQEKEWEIPAFLRKVKFKN